MTAHRSTGPAGDACTRCRLGMARRDFLRDAALAAALMVGLTARRGQAAVIPRLITGVVRGRGQVTYPLPATDGVSIDREREIILARSAGKIYSFYLSCPHQHTALKWVEKHDRFECPKHHSKYQIDGEYISGRATRSMDRYAVQVTGDEVVVDPDRLFRQDRDPQGWAAAYAVVPGAGAAP